MWGSGLVMESMARRRSAGMNGALAGLIGIAGVLALTPVRARAAGDQWDDGRHWVSVRAGFVRSGARFAPGGS